MNYSKAVISIILAFSFAACNNGQQKDDNVSQIEENIDIQEENNEVNQSQNSLDIDKNVANSILSNYYTIKDALVETDSEAAKSEAEKLFASIEENKSGLLQKIRIDAKKILNTSDVKEQRKHFESLSHNVYEMVKITKANNSTVYRQYCPMAMNNKGAYWLSSEEKIRNPYFGNMMLKCGSIEETLN